MEDKDIEILKNMKGFFSDCEVCTDDCDEKTCVYLRTIENVLAELERYKKMCELFGKSLINISGEKTSLEELLDWAKSEVLKDEEK